MRRPFAFAACTAALGLAACSQDPPEQAPKTETPEPATPVKRATPAVGATDTPAETGGYASVYSDFDLAACRVTAEQPEGTGVDYACPGREGIPLFAHHGDGRFDLDAGVDGEEFMTIGAFNEIADRIEWRTNDGTPFAVIFRYRDVAPGSAGRTVLAIEKIGRAGAPGCRVAQIAGDTADANRVAREIADTRAAAFRCGTDEARIVGDAR
ncbi:hypothetical protein [Pelagerythrobacter sp.]|uniref:hypothetical protein n=1 Tax=Pelagerythrobacter sp. TaxID=2800702 RepID=UPI0035B2D484